jgi:hypothetical protein
MGLIIGKPEEPKKDERHAFYIHKNLLCYLDIQPDGVFVEGKDSKGSEIFRRPFPNIHDAMTYIENKKELYDSNQEGNNGKRTSASSGGDQGTPTQS